MSVRLSNAVGICPVCKNESILKEAVHTSFWHSYKYTRYYCGIDVCRHSIIKDESRQARHLEAVELWQRNKITGDEFLKRIWE